MTFPHLPAQVAPAPSGVQHPEVRQTSPAAQQALPLQQNCPLPVQFVP